MVIIQPAPLSSEGLYDKVGGWLVFPAISTGLSPFFLAYSAFENFSYFNRSLPIVAQEILVVSGLGCVGLMIGWFYACVLLSRLDWLYPRTFILLVLGNLVLSFSVLIATSIYLNTYPSAEESRDLVRSILIALVWVPYMLFSRRVKATFYGIPIPLKISPKSTMACSSYLEDDYDLKGRFRRRGHRYGILITVAGILVLVLGVISSIDNPHSTLSSFLILAGLAGSLFGYIFARLWYWAKSA